MRRVLVIVAALILSGCATSSVMNGIMQSWEGAKIDSVVAQWGYPDEQREFNGKKLYIWNHNKSVTMPTTTNTTGSVNAYGAFSATSTTTGGNTFNGQCQRTLEVDANGTVTKWQWQGNNCPFMEAMEYKYWRNKTPRN